MRKLLLTLLFVLIAVCEDIEIKEEEKIPVSTPHKVPPQANDYARQLDKLLLYQCVQLVNVKVSMQYNTTLQELFAPMSKESRQNYIQKLMLLNIEKCVKVMKSNEFIELLKEKDNNKTHDFVLDRLEVPLKDPSNLELTSGEVELVNKLNELKKEMDGYNETTSKKPEVPKPEPVKIVEDDVRVSNTYLIILIGGGILTVILIAKCLFRSSPKETTMKEMLLSEKNKQAVKKENGTPGISLEKKNQ
jgi:hypothetical protein